VKLTENFTSEELACKCGCGMLPRPESVQRLQLLRERCGFPFTVTSGARCAKRNNEVATTGDDGPHTKGGAFDIGISGERALVLVDRAREVGFTGIGVKQKGPHAERCIHVDDLPNADGQPRPTIWSY
jgi:uncharacterized protein YcbK (DUF882 family)